ncbi:MULTISPECIES: chromosomal replication initiator protein DnaA [Bacteroidota]|uniref:Chromosomal replication initiator protein DnaA n=1 Tax=Flectobacillus rivi TaxID=2984209 RepID=A0ABT6YZW2_9BACT|nr:MULTISPECIES: chromosomal replication initiator protein DnaA [Bacteroidota]MDI9874410.1 chromosomal replication initiator protein DnaA [Flectobacillus rivi]NBB26804.1 chromosomal replication initiator protein DnaA [Cellulophaga sp. BC115SP]
MQTETRQVWAKCLEIIRQEVNEQSFKTWFEPIVPLRIQHNTLTIQVPSQFFYEWLEENYVHALRKAIDYTLGRQGMLEYSIIVDKGDRKNPPIALNVPNQKSTTPPPVQRRPEPTIYESPFQLKDLDSLELDSYLNPHYAFDNFVEGDCNRLGRSAGLAVAQRPGVTSFNPLMIYGGVGLGKTHLIQAIGNYIKSTQSNKFVLYVSSEKFVNQFINAIRNNTLQAFTNFYMQIDVLILDDVQFLAGKEKTQESFFHIFNHLHQSGKQIIMSSDRPPRDLAGMQDRLLSRFKWGLTADLQQPDFETRIAIIQKKLQADGIYIKDEVIEYLAHSVDTNVRELEGVIVSLMAHASLNRREIDMDLARTTLKNIVVDNEKEITVDNIFDAIIAHFDVTMTDLKGKSRKKEIVFPRQVAMYLMKEFTNLPLKSIGYHFGGRDHSTVIHAVQNISVLIDSDKDVEGRIQKLYKHFNRVRVRA